MPKKATKSTSRKKRLSEKKPNRMQTIKSAIKIVKGRKSSIDKRVKKALGK